MKLSIILFTLSFSLFADYKAQFCTETSDIQKRAADVMNELAFTNPSGMDIPIIGDIIGLPDGIGACWWHTKMQRAALYLAAFRPELEKPTPVEAKVLIKKLQKMQEVVIVPGFTNLREFSYEYAEAFEQIITEWQTLNSTVGFRWVVSIGTSIKEKLLPDHLKEMMDDLYEEVKSGEIVFQHLPYVDDITNHAWLVIGMEKISRGYKLNVIDSNQTDYYNIEGGSGHQETEYLYGDRYISYRGDKVVPFTDTVGEDIKLKTARNDFCEGVELIPEAPVVIAAPENVVEIEEGAKLTVEQIERALYSYLTMEEFSYNHILYIVYMLHSEQANIGNFFKRVVNGNEDLPAYLMARMLFLAEELRDLRQMFSEEMLKMISMTSATSDIADIMLPIAFATGDPVDHVGEITKIIIDRFGVTEGHHKTILYGLASADKKVKGSYQLINMLLDSSIEYDERELKFIADAIYFQRKELIAEHVLLKKLLKKTGITSIALSRISWITVDADLYKPLNILEKVLNHPAADLETVESIVRTLKNHWPRLEGDDVFLLEKVSTHSIFGAEVRDEAKKAVKFLNEKGLARDTIKKLDFDNLNLKTMISYGNRVSILEVDATNLDEENQSFILKIGLINPMDIIVKLKNLHKVEDPKKISVVFEAPAHVFYETEKTLFDKIFSCSSKRCKESVNGVLLFTKDGISLYDTSGIKANQISITGSR